MRIKVYSKPADRFTSREMSAAARLIGLVHGLQGSPLCFHQRDRGNNRTMVLHVRERLQVSARRLSRVGYLHGLRSWLAHLESRDTWSPREKRTRSPLSAIADRLSWVRVTASAGRARRALEKRESR